MMQIHRVAHIDKIGAMGAGGKKGGLRVTKEERINLVKSKGCPINCRVSTTLSRSSFKTMCLKHQKRASSLNGSSVTKQGFRSNNLWLCPECHTGKCVRDNVTFKAPFNITFKDLLTKYK